MPSRFKFYPTDTRIFGRPLKVSEIKKLTSMDENNYNQIIKEVWGFSDSNAAKNIRVCMASLRRKIETDPAEPHYITTEIGIGYRFISGQSST